jgi:DNA repair protein RadC
LYARRGEGVALSPLANPVVAPSARDTQGATLALAHAGSDAGSTDTALQRALADLDGAELLTLVAGARAGRLLGALALAELARTDPWSLAREQQLEFDDALRLGAAFELGRRAETALRPARTRLDCAAEVQRVLAPEVRGLEQELFFVLALDGKHALLRRHCVTIGSLNSSLVHPREVFRPAIQAAAAAVICAHNHPSGDPEPSAEDLSVTRRLADVGKLVGIPLLDHVVLGEGRCVSLRQRIAWS